ncbi:hypothetical protein GS580_16575 [Rhodococcus hoagii]|nr:hypothetical protein [Prescottella equi]NKS12553.1 hypothetical protein [Prescottella equi]
MSKPRKDYAYFAARIDPEHPQNLGDFSISRRLPSVFEEYVHHRRYHFNSKNGRLINRNDSAMPVIQSGSQIYRECMKAIDRLKAEEAR